MTRGPVTSALLVGLLVLLTAVAAGCGLSDPYAADTQGTTTGRPARASGAMPPPDPQDHDPAVRARSRRLTEATPALQHLPFAGDGIAIDFGDLAPDGRLRLTVLYTGSAPAAHQAYRRFLARWGDDGDGYVVEFRHRSPAGRAPSTSPGAPRRSPEAVLEAVALAAGNWWADEIEATYARAIALSVGTARTRLTEMEAQARTGAERVGPSLHSHADVVAIDVEGAGDSRPAVVVVRTGLAGGGLPDGAYTYQVVLARVEREGGGWAVASWRPQS